MSRRKKILIQTIAFIVLTAALIITLIKPRGALTVVWIAAVAILWIADIGLLVDMISEIIKAFKKDKNSQENRA